MKKARSKPGQSETRAADEPTPEVARSGRPGPARGWRPEAAAGAAAYSEGMAPKAYDTILATAAFFLLAASLVVRPLLGEYWTIRVNDLVSPSPLWWNNSPGVMYVVHILGGIGLLLGTAWMIIGRRRWRFCGLELGALLMTLAALISVPGASDRRLAINVAVGTILPLAIAAVLYQFLITRGVWRRAVLAALIAAAAANSYVSWRQKTVEQADTVKQYMANKAAYWAARGKTVNDPDVAIFEARLKAGQPTGFFYHPNVMASVLLLGLFGSAAGLVGLRLHRKGSHDPVLGQQQPHQRPQQQQQQISRKRAQKAQKIQRQQQQQINHKGPQKAQKIQLQQQDRRIRQRGRWELTLVIAAGVGLVGLACWQLVVIRWVGTRGRRSGCWLEWSRRLVCGCCDGGPWWRGSCAWWCLWGWRGR